MKTTERKIAIASAIIVMACMLLTIFAPRANAQKMQTSKEYHDKLQKENSWENYQSNYKKLMLSNAKESRKQKREQKQADKQRQKFLARIERIKGN